MHQFGRFVTIAILFICMPATAQEWPDPSARWEVQQYKAVLEQLSRLPPTELPRISDDRFGAVFAHVVDRESFSSLLLPDGTVEARLKRCLELMGVITEINRRYAIASTSDASYSREAIRLLGFMLIATKQQLSIFDDFTKTLDKTDPTYATRMVGVAQMRFGMSQMMLGALHCIEETGSYSVEERLKLAIIISETFPSFTAKIDRDVSDALSYLKERISKENKDPSIRKALSEKLKKE